jgi:hypothetical protein
LKQQIDFDVGQLRRGPVEDFVIQLALLGVGSQQREDPSFEKSSALFGRDWTVSFLDRANQPRVDPIELRVFTLPHPELGFHAVLPTPLGPKRKKL